MYLPKAKFKKFRSRKCCTRNGTVESLINNIIVFVLCIYAHIFIDMSKIWKALYEFMYKYVL